MIKEKIVDLLIDVLGVNSEFCNELNFAEGDLMKDIGMDSLQLINFFMGIEDEFDIEIDFEEFNA